METPPPPTPSHQGRGNLLRGIPYFSRAQLGVILLLGAALLLLWGWRAHFGRPPSPAPAQTMNPVFVEVTGAAAHPGLYSFPQPPSLSEVWRRAGGTSPAPPTQIKLTSGTRLEINQAGGYRMGRMPGPQLVTIGLAVDLNQATAPDLEGLPGIGPAMAKRIVDYRTAHGPFKKIDDLQQVSGIGPGKLEKIKPYLSINSQGPVAPDY